MKKIVSLVLALVLVLAIAAPAMAITGYEKPTTPTASAVAPYAGGISLIDARADAPVRRHVGGLIAFVVILDVVHRIVHIETIFGAAA